MGAESLGEGWAEERGEAARETQPTEGREGGGASGEELDRRL